MQLSRWVDQSGVFICNGNICYTILFILMWWLVCLSDRGQLPADRGGEERVRSISRNHDSEGRSLFSFAKGNKKLSNYCSSSESWHTLDLIDEYTVCMRCTPTQCLYQTVAFFVTNNENVCVLTTLQATEQFASDVLREALAGAYAKSPPNRSALEFSLTNIQPAQCSTFHCIRVTVSQAYLNYQLLLLLRLDLSTSDQ